CFQIDKMPAILQPDVEFARQKDQEDPLFRFRSRFYYPNAQTHEADASSRQGREAIYFCGNSLGLQAKDVESAIQQELKDWQELAIGGYLGARNPWMTYQQPFRPPLSRIMGCLEEEVTVMNALTVNLHLLLLSFYRPQHPRYKI